MFQEVKHNVFQDELFDKVLNCLFLSAEAKILYAILLKKSTIKEGKQVCIESQSNLAVQLGWTIDTLEKYLKELKEKGFIKIHKSNLYKILIYEICNCEDNSYIKHSEVISMITPTSYRAIKKFLKVLKRYQKSDLFRIVTSSSNPFAFINDIKDYFYGQEL